MAFWGMAQLVLSIAAIAVGIFFLAYFLLFHPPYPAEELARSVARMGHMRTFGRFGFEWWGAMHPARMWQRGGRCFRPLALGFWIRDPNHDHKGA